MIAAVNKLFLLGPRSKFNAVFSFLQKKGVLELADSHAPGRENTGKDADFYNMTARKLEDIKDAIDFLGEGSVPVIKRPGKNPGFDVDKIISRSRELRESISMISQQLDEKEKKAGYFSGLLSSGVPLEKLAALKNIVWKIFEIPRRRSAEFEEFLSGINETAFAKFSFSKKKSSYLVLCPKDMQIAPDFKAQEKNIPHDAAGQLKKLRSEIPALKSDLKTHLDEKKHLARYLPQLMLVYDYYENVKLREKNKNENIFETGKMFLMTGWLKTDDIENFRKNLSAEFPYIFMDSRPPRADEDVPVRLVNSKFVKSYEALTSMYGTPAYGSVDPSPNVAVFFAFFFGLCLTDAAYGLVIFIVSFFLMRRKNISAGLRKAAKVFFAGGFFTIVAGAATGGWFGDLFSRLPPQLGFFKAAADKLVIFDPIKNALVFVGLAIACGFIQVLWGMVLKCIDDIKNGHIANFLFEDLAAMLIQTSLPVIVAAYALGVFRLEGAAKFAAFTALAAGSASIIFFNLITQKGVIFKILWSYYGVYSVITGNAFSDVLSYVRLFALGLTTGLLATAINQIIYIVISAGKFMWPLAAVLFVILHAFNILINMLGATVHTLRLQYYEFFTKFIRTGGHYFNPLRNFVKYSSMDN